MNIKKYINFSISLKNLLIGTIALFLFMFPVIRLILLSISTESQTWTFAQYKILITDIRAEAAIWNTVYISFAASFISAAGGIITAFFVAYTNLRHKNIIELLVFLPFVIPAYVITLSWTELTASNGFLSMVLEKIGISPINLYSAGGIIVVLGICHISVVYAAVVHMLRKVPLETRWAAQVSGCPVWKSLIKIDLPMVMPAVAGGTALAFLADIDNFAVPAFLGISSNIPVLSTYIYEKVISFGPDSFAYGAVLSVILSGIALSGAGLASMMSHKEKIMENAQEDYAIRISFSSKKRQLMEGGILFVLALFSIIPFIYMAGNAMVTGSILSATPFNLTWDNYYFVFTNNGLKEAVCNSFFMAGTAMVLCLGMGTLIAYFLVRDHSRAAVFLSQCASITYSVPGIVLALALIFYWSQPVPGINTGLYGSYSILILGYVTRYMIIQIKNSAAAFATISEVSEQAALISGSSYIRMWVAVIVPQLVAPALSGAFFIFLSAFTELTMSSVMSSASTKTIGLAIFNLQQGGDYNLAAAVSIILIIIIAIVLGIQKIFEEWYTKRGI